ncbi:MAG: cytochrome c biogenesis protein CcsA [Bryobacterales bacterium]|nr:cytochrome c biogenesis protein [Bryobacteraceae bacterium]MDW8352915.1 cytochrome c biogenesis protein CcsA [Bryobacterales bacterium]
MREKILVGLAGLAGLLLVRNLYVMLLELPDEAAQGAIYRIIFFHVPAAWTAFVCFFVALVASVLYLLRKNLRYDAVAVSATEVGLAFGAVNLVTGMIWARIIWGIWWTWDARLTSMLVCWLLYAGYLMLRRAVEDPTLRARFAAVFSIFAFVDVPIVWFSIKWWRTQHPGPVVWGGGSMDPAMYQMLFLNWVPVLLLGAVLTLLRMRLEETQRAVEALRQFR